MEDTGERNLGPGPALLAVSSLISRHCRLLSWLRQESASGSVIDAWEALGWGRMAGAIGL